MIKIRETKSRTDQRKFTTFPNTLYKNVESFVPAFTPDEMKIFSKDNPVKDYCDFVCFLAYKGDKIVGRVAGIINHKINASQNSEQARFTRFDVIDDLEVSKALINAVTKWAKEKGMNNLIGPIGFTDFDRMGLLVEGFDYLNLFITIYNPPYYLVHLESLGFKKDVDWVEKRITVPDILPDKIVRGAEIVRKRYGFRLLKPQSKKEVIKYIYDAFAMYNKAFSDLYGFHPLSENAMEFYVKQVLALIQKEYVWFVFDDVNNIAGFGVVMPSLAVANKRSNGHLFPFGWFRILRSLQKSDVVDMYFIAVDPRHQGKGVPALILEDAFKVMRQNGIKYAETGPELELNGAIHSQWKHFEYIEHKRRRCFTKNI